MDGWIDGWIERWREGGRKGGREGGRDGCRYGCCTHQQAATTTMTTMITIMRTPATAPPTAPAETELSLEPASCDDVGRDVGSVAATVLCVCFIRTFFRGSKCTAKNKDLRERGCIQYSWYEGGQVMTHHICISALTLCSLLISRRLLGMGENTFLLHSKPIFGGKFPPPPPPPPHPQYTD